MALKKVILNNIWGQVESGQLMGILGPSGAWKTTLLNVLTLSIIRPSNLSGDYLIISGVISKNSFSNRNPIKSISDSKHSGLRKLLGYLSRK